jgi:hypothetical protein
MRLIVPLTALAVIPLAALAVGCDDGAPPVVSRETIAVGTLPAELPTTSAGTAVGTTVDTEPDDPTTTDDPTPTTSRDAGDPTAPTDPAPTTPGSQPAIETRFVEVLDGLVEGDIPPRVETTTLRDDTGRLRIAVPEDWSDHRTEPSRLPAGGETPSLAASPDLTSFLDGYDTPGLTALVVDADPQDALGAYTFAGDCSSGRRGDYVGDGSAGRWEVWESCGGTFDDIVTLAVRPTGADETVLLLVQLVDPADLAALDAAVASLSLAD